MRSQDTAVIVALAMLTLLAVCTPDPEHNTFAQF
jgi:hypothetical protein